MVDTFCLTGMNILAGGASNGLKYAYSKLTSKRLRL